LRRNQFYLSLSEMSQPINLNQPIDDILDEAARVAAQENLLEEELLGPEEEGHVPVSPSEAEELFREEPPQGTQAGGPDEDMKEEDEEEEIRKVMEPAPTADSPRPTVETLKYGPTFLDVLDRFLIALEPYAVMKENYSEMKTFSDSARIRMINETKNKVRDLYDELHEALFLDRKIRFKKPEFTPSVTLFGSREFNCPCPLVHLAVVNCPHYDKKHEGFCQKTAYDIAKRAGSKAVTERSVQTDNGDRSQSRSSSVSTPKTKETVKATLEFVRGRGRGRGYRIPFKPRGHAASSSGRDTEIERERVARELRRRENERERERSRSIRQRSPPTCLPPRYDDRGRDRFPRKHYQPAQDRLREERRRFEDPKIRQEAERIAEYTKIEADKKAALLKTAEAGPSRSTGFEAGPSRSTGPDKLKKKSGHGDCALKPDGTTDWENCPVVAAPPGMKAVVVEKEGKWHVTMETK
jgi:hypothetical protein